MDHSTSIFIDNPQAGVESNFPGRTHFPSPLEIVHRLTPSAQSRTTFRAQAGCAALVFAALVVAAAYILIPLAMALHAALHPVLLAVGIATAALVETALIVTFIVLKTEGPAE